MGHAESTTSLCQSLACLGELWINYSLLANSRGKRPCAFKPGQVGVWLARGLNQTNNYHKPFLEEHWAGRTHVLGAGYLTYYKTLGMFTCASWYL